MEASSLSNSVAIPSSDLGKLFVGGITDGTREDEIKDHFKKFGEVKEVVMVKDRATGNARGFVFVQFENPDSAEVALEEEEHLIAGRKVEVKRAKPKSERWTYPSHHHQYPFPSQHENRGLNNNAANHYCMNENPTKPKKIFVGGLPSSVTEDEFRSYFEKFGRITDVVIMYDSTTQRPRGFGFVTFDSEEAVESVMQQNCHQLSNKYIEVKLAVPRDGNNHNSSSACNGSSYNSSMCGRRRGYVNSYQGGVYPSYIPSNGFYSGYAPPASEYFYGMGGYGGGYPAGPYDGIGYVAPFLSPRIPYNGPGMMRRSPMHYGNATMYEGFSDSGFGGYMGVGGGSGHYGTAWSGNGNFYPSGDDVRITEDNTRTDDGSVAVDAQQAS